MDFSSQDSFSRERDGAEDGESALVEFERRSEAEGETRAGGGGGKRRTTERWQHLDPERATSLC